MTPQINLGQNPFPIQDLGSECDERCENCKCCNHDPVVAFDGSFDEMTISGPSQFDLDIMEQNRMFRLNEVPYNDLPAQITRLKKFLPTIRDEVTEGDDILTSMENWIVADHTPEENEEFYRNTVVDLTDWYSDIQVYAASECLKILQGLYAHKIKSSVHEADPALVPLPSDILSFVMHSNFSKKWPDAQGNKYQEVRYDENGKFMSGPDKVPAEKMIRSYVDSVLDNLFVPVEEQSDE